MGRLEDATNLSINYIQTILSGKGLEYFGFTSILQATSPPVYVSFNIIEILLLELEAASLNDQTYLKVFINCLIQ